MKIRIPPVTRVRTRYKGTEDWNGCWVRWSDDLWRPEAPDIPGTVRPRMMSITVTDGDVQEWLNVGSAIRE